MLAASHGHEKRVLAKLTTLAGERRLTGGVDPGQRVFDPFCLGTLGDPPQLVPTAPAETDGLAHRERPVYEVVVGAPPT